MQKDLPLRKKIRLEGHDYSSAGCYFITICVEGKHEMLGTVGRDALGAPCIDLSEYGDIIQKEIEETHLYYKNIVVDKFVIMPNHVHMIIIIDDENGAPRASRPTTALIPMVIAILKKKTNKRYVADLVS